MAQPRPRKDQDARSAVSSFYGAPSEQAPPYGSPRSQYDPNQYDAEKEGGYGYSQTSYRHQPDAIEPVKGGYDEEDLAEGQGGWDIYADFNNAGPRYSNVPFAGTMKSNDGYRPLKPPAAPSSNTPSKKAASSDYEPQVELVTVPAMGAEWSAAELEDMKKSTKRRRKADSRKRAWREFARDQKGLFGIPFLTRTRLVWISFGLVIVVGLILFICIPRVPTFGFAFGQPLVGNGGPTPYFNYIPANFSFTGGIDLQADTHSSFVPLHMKNLTAYLYTSATDKLVATGSWGPETLKARSYTPVMINMTFAYSAINTTDPTWNLMHDACKNINQFPNATRPGLNVRLVLQMDIWGLIGTQGTSTIIEDAPCPIMLPSDAS